MKKLLRFLIAVGIGITASAFLAPVLYSFLPVFKFEKIFNRLLMISFVIILICFIRADRKLLDECGLSNRKSWAREWGSGFVISLLALLLLVILEFQLGALKTIEPFKLSAGVIGSALATGVLVGAFEEFFFRGFTYLNLKKRVPVLASLLVTNSFYAAVHFLKSGRPLIGPAPTFWDSFRVLQASFEAFLNWGIIWPGFVGLFLFGMVLSFSFLKTQSIFTSMGLHGGAVFFLKLAAEWYQIQPGYSGLIFGGKGFYSGLLGWIFIIGIGFAVHLTYLRQNCLEKSRP